MAAEPTKPVTADFDIFVIGGGINGCGIARDAAGRGLRVGLAEKDDLAVATSSASTKLFHGGLRYLEFFEFRLVREALKEREVLLQAMPHISWPMRFVLPWYSEMRFESETNASRLLAGLMPWMKGRRPAWMIRLGLFLYDHLGGRKILPGTRAFDLRHDPAGKPLKSHFHKAFEYSDCWVEDARLVSLNARDARQRGAKVMTRTKVVGATREADSWLIALEDADGNALPAVRANMLVNAGGPWVEKVLKQELGCKTAEKIRLVRGSHIVTKRLFDHDRCYFLQGEDGRIIFAIPYEDDFTLIGTTDMDHEGAPGSAVCTDEEKAYLCDFISNYLEKPVMTDDIVWSYSGVRPLYDDGASSATAATRDYVLSVNAEGGAPVLSVFGGKITTYRRLAESAMEKIAPFMPDLGQPWTRGAALPGGDFAVADKASLVTALEKQFTFLDSQLARRLIRHYGTEAPAVLGNAASLDDLGVDFGGSLYECEIRWLANKEFARRAEDIVWRRTKQGLRMDEEQIAALDHWMLMNLPK